MGIMVQSWPKVVGSDVSGEVHEAGFHVKNFKKGDRVVGVSNGLLTGTPESGAFSLYTKVPAKTAAIIPSNVSFKDASVLGLAIGTASCGLNGEKYLAQPFPTTNPKPSGKVLFVHGGSTSIGSMTTQLAKAAGIRVITTASPGNFDFCLKAGASEVFDYNDSHVVDKIVEAVSKDTFVGIYDSVSDDNAYKMDFAIFEKLGGGKVVTCHPPPENLPSSVKAEWMMGVGEHSAPIWGEFVTEALSNGQLKCLPEPLVVGKGLESLQKALERSKAGVSAQKLVVEL